ncbi:flagellin N-terminal helical domain-containing protein [Sphingomonas baiyangensis]|uniref:Flagellin n=1 Tax=Sphingomonas baiyangensis TaxID=2572576 RepID=A0A4U1L3A7_9SPHN|nr:flagellin [Sphingomonas baiyangensis]TKD51152.1 flagellar biosynthesis protein FlgL [Sphingomonas baiyangensis]
MRVSTNQFFARSTLQMAQLSGSADTLQTQIATGKRIERPSDDAGAHQRLATLARGTADDAAAKTNITLAQGILGQTDTTLAAIEQHLQRASELAIQAGSDTLNDGDRAGIAGAIDGMLADLMALANTRDLRGQPIFGGGADAAFARGADGAIAYVGGAAGATIPIGDGTAMQVSEAGDATLGAMFSTLQAMAAALHEGGNVKDAMADAIGGIDAALDQVSTTRSSVGARAFRLDMEMERLGDVGLAREEARSSLEDVDISAAITELQKTLTILQATQSTFTRLSSLSLFDQLR